MFFKIILKFKLIDCKNINQRLILNKINILKYNFFWFFKLIFIII